MELTAQPQAEMVAAVAVVVRHKLRAQVQQEEVAQLIKVMRVGKKFLVNLRLITQLEAGAAQGLLEETM